MAPLTAHLATEQHHLHYKVFGSAENPPLLILHGFLGSWKDFLCVLPQLKAHFYCILPDLPGHGKTTTFEGGYRFDATVRSLLSLLNHLQLTKTNLLGYSMGGRIALSLACQHPNRISSTILESASPGLRTAAERNTRIDKDEAIARQIETLPISEFIAKWYEQSLFKSLQQHPEAYASMLERRVHNISTELANALRGLGTGVQAPMWDCLHTANFPLMLMFGLKDHKFSALSKAIAEECKSNNKQKIVLSPFSACGHNIHLEISQTSPKLYAEAILDFLTECQALT